MVIALASLLAIAVIAFILTVRPKDLPIPEPESPFAHLDERKAAIYENLRDLQFEYRVGKLSDEDYQSTKRDLQKELAGVLAEVDRLKGQVGQAGRPAQPPQAATNTAANGARRPAPTPRAPTPNPQPPTPFSCPACGAHFDHAMKFCGECGTPMRVVQ
jgi:hypothetical protein